MKKTKRTLAALISVLMLGTVSAIPTAYAEDSVPFTATVDDIFTDGYFGVMFKSDYTKDMIEKIISNELKEIENVKDIYCFNAVDTGSERDVYIVELMSSDKENVYNTAKTLNDTGYFYFVDVNAFGIDKEDLKVQNDESLPFTANPDDNFIANKLSVIFKSKYSGTDIEKIISELKEMNGVKDFEYMSSNLYIINLTFESSDKESAYNTAKALYDTGYFYSVEMNMVGTPDVSEDEIERFTMTISPTKVLKANYYDDDNGLILKGIDTIFSINGDTGMNISYHMPKLKQGDTIEGELFVIYFPNEKIYYVSDGNIDIIGKGGDSNCDGDMNMADAVLVMQSLANPDKYGINGTDETHITEQGKINADFKDDGLTNEDALFIQKKMLRLS